MDDLEAEAEPEELTKPPLRCPRCAGAGTIQILEDSHWWEQYDVYRPETGLRSCPACAGTGILGLESDL